jgi:nicotinamidase-related amidase
MEKLESARSLFSRKANQAALLVIDVQAGLFSANPAPFEATEVIQRINSVMAKARSAGVRSFFVQHDGSLEDRLVPFSESWRLHGDLQKEPGDPVIRKTMGDAFYGTTLEQDLRSSEIRSVVLMGYATEFCIDATLRAAVSREFEVFIISDAHTTNDAPMLNAWAIRHYFNWVWSETPSPRGIHLLPAAEVRFSTLGLRKE